jgi:hypothetical protein
MALPAGSCQARRVEADAASFGDVSVTVKAAYRYPQRVLSINCA